MAKVPNRLEQHHYETYLCTMTHNNAEDDRTKNEKLKGEGALLDYSIKMQYSEEDDTQKRWAGLGLKGQPWES